MSASARFRGLFGLPGHFPCPQLRSRGQVRRRHPLLAEVQSSLEFSGSACGFGLGVEVSEGSEAVLCSFPTLREAPPILARPFWSTRALEQRSLNTQSCCRSCLCRKVCTCLCTCQHAGGFECAAGARGYDHCDSVSGCAGLSGVERALFFGRRES